MPSVPLTLFLFVWFGFCDWWYPPYSEKFTQFYGDLFSVLVIFLHLCNENANRKNRPEFHRNFSPWLLEVRVGRAASPAVGVCPYSSRPEERAVWAGVTAKASPLGAGEMGQWRRRGPSSVPSSHTG